MIRDGIRAFLNERLDGKGPPWRVCFCAVSIRPQAVNALGRLPFHGDGLAGRLRRRISN